MQQQQSAVAMKKVTFGDFVPSASKQALAKKPPKKKKLTPADFDNDVYDRSDPEIEEPTSSDNAFIASSGEEADSALEDSDTDLSMNEGSAVKSDDSAVKSEDEDSDYRPEPSQLVITPRNPQAKEGVCPTGKKRPAPVRRVKPGMNLSAKRKITDVLEKEGGEICSDFSDSDEEHQRVVLARDRKKQKNKKMKPSPPPYSPPLCSDFDYSDEDAKFNKKRSLPSHPAIDARNLLNKTPSQELFKQYAKRSQMKREGELKKRYMMAMEENRKFYAVSGDQGKMEKKPKSSMKNKSATAVVPAEKKEKKKKTTAPLTSTKSVEFLDSTVSTDEDELEHVDIDDLEGVRRAMEKEHEKGEREKISVATVTASCAVAVVTAMPPQQVMSYGRENQLADDSSG